MEQSRELSFNRDRPRERERARESESARKPEIEREREGGREGGREGERERVRGNRNCPFVYAPVRMRLNAPISRISANPHAKFSPSSRTGTSGGGGLGPILGLSQASGIKVSLCTCTVSVNPASLSHFTRRQGMTRCSGEEPAKTTPSRTTTSGRNVDIEVDLDTECAGAVRQKWRFGKKLAGPSPVRSSHEIQVKIEKIKTPCKFRVAGRAKFGSIHVPKFQTNNPSVLSLVKHRTECDKP